MPGWGAGPIERKTLKRPRELGSAPPPAISVASTSPPTPEQREELPHGNAAGVWREKFRTPAPCGRKNPGHAVRAPGSKSSSITVIIQK